MERVTTDSENVLRARLHWVQIYERTRDAGLTCRRCGISRPTLRKWWQRYSVHGQEGLRSHSRRRHNLPPRKVTAHWEKEILRMRRKRRLGPRRIQSELRRNGKFSLSTATIWKVLHHHQVASLRRPYRPMQPVRYSRPVPGERVQMDTCKIGPNLIQFTAIDDCTRIRVLGIYPARTVENAVLFFQERVLEEFPFPIQRIQTDRGAEFFGTAFQLALREHQIKFRPNRPRAPHLNGKVERSQQTDKVEFWPTVRLNTSLSSIEQDVELWQHYYNWERPHFSLDGQPPMDRFLSLTQQTPFSDELTKEYQEESEPFRERDYRLDLRLLKLKRCR